MTRTPLFPAARPVKDRRTTGRGLLVTFRTGVDLSEWVPEPLHCVDPHVGVLMAWRMKTRYLGEAPESLDQSQYQEVAISVLAGAPDHEPRHHNLLSLHSQAWARRNLPLGPRTRHATIESTWTFPSGAAFDRDADWREFDIDASRLGSPILRFRGSLGEDVPRFDEAPYRGLIGVTYRDVPTNGRLPSATVDEEVLKDVTIGRVTYGTGELSFFASPDDRPLDEPLLRELGTVQVLGASLRDMAWTQAAPG